MRLGIGILGFDRPELLSRCCDHLKKNDLRNTETWLFQDGYYCHITGKFVADPKEIQDSLSIFVAHGLPGLKTVYQGGPNYGTALNRLAMLEKLSERYEAFIALEGDIIVSRNFVALARKLLNQFAGDPALGGFRSPLCPTRSRDANSIYLDEAHIGAMFTWSSRLKPILEHYRIYIDLIRNRPYRSQSKWAPEVRSLMKEVGTSSDAALEWAGKQAGTPFWSLGAPRAKNIGEKGLHMLPHIHRSLGMDAVALIEYPGELTQTWRKVQAQAQAQA